MRVAGLDKRGDWRFGRGRAVYLAGSKAIGQKVVTRLRSFKRDWFLDVDAGVDWIQLLGMRNSEAKMLREIERVIVTTEGVLRLVSLEADINRTDRTAWIRARYEDVFNREFDLTESLAP